MNHPRPRLPQPNHYARRAGDTNANGDSPQLTTGRLHKLLEALDSSRHLRDELIHLGLSPVALTAAVQAHVKHIERRMAHGRL